MSVHLKLGLRAVVAMKERRAMNWGTVKKSGLTKELPNEEESGIGHSSYSHRLSQSREKHLWHDLLLG